MKSLLILLSLSVVLLNYDSAFSQMPASPARLMQRNAIMLVETPNAQELINHLKRDYYDQFYRWAIDEEKIKPLELTGVRYALKTQKIEHRHWLTTSAASICKRSFPAAKDLLSLIDAFVDNKFHISSDEEDEIVSNLSRLFPGRMFIGLENHSPYCTLVFGFECDPDSFDWLEELKATAAVQNGNENAAGFSDGLQIFHLPLEEVYFFSIDNVVYGTADVSIDSCVEFAKEGLPLIYVNAMSFGETKIEDHGLMRREAEK